MKLRSTRSVAKRTSRNATDGQTRSHDGDREIEAAIRLWGERLFHLIEAAGEPSLFRKKGFYGALMEWAMHDPHFRTQLFRFVDVLPGLNSSAEIARHLKEYLGGEQANLSPTLRTALRASTGDSWLLGPTVKAQVTKLACQFMLGDDDQEIVQALRRLHEQGIGFTMDVLGETVVSESEADHYATRYLALLDLLARETKGWIESTRGPLEAGQGGGTVSPSPVLNLSLKVSALYSQIHAADPETAIEQISARLRPILRRARAMGALINFDMEHYALKPLTLALFKRVFSEPEFNEGPACGLALQAYLKDAEADLNQVIAWAKGQRRRIAVRLVKGAYWDYEVVHAAQKGWVAPVYQLKAESDANFEKLSVLLLQNTDAVEPAFGSHNVRSIAHVLAWAERLQTPPARFEFQMLYGMADPLKASLVQLGYRVREYCPVGELLPGMAYLVRRLLENTSNEGFLAQAFSKKTSHAELLQRPSIPSLSVQDETVQIARENRFSNEPPTDFTLPEAREHIRSALVEVRKSLGRRYPLVIGGESAQTAEWLPSLNPAKQQEVIGYAAQATIDHANAALRAAQAASLGWARTPAEQRAHYLRSLGGLLQRDKAKFTALEILEAGKQWSEADADVGEAIDFCYYYAHVMSTLGRPRSTQRIAGELNYQHWWPRGVGLIIAPWNFPLAILTGMTMAAVVAGNPVIMKPSDQTPVIAAELMARCQEVGFPPGAINLLTGPGSTIGAYLVEHPGVDFIAFTGSKEVGLKIWDSAGRTRPGQRGLKKVVCEMGGKNAVIVDTDADLDEAVMGCLVSAFGYQGQKCSALSRLIVLADVSARFLERLVQAASSLRVGPAEEPGNVLGPVISRVAQERILRFIEVGRKEATLTWQGCIPDDPNACYVPPTIFTDVPAQSRLFQEEIFGPILAVTTASTFEEALTLANASEFALTGGLYSRSPANIERTKAEMVCGNLYINRSITGAIVERQPFGGFRMSGGGTKAGGREYLENFMVPRVVSENTLRRGFAAEQESGATDA